MTLELLQAFLPISFVQTYVVPPGRTSLFVRAHGGDGGRTNRVGKPGGRGQYFEGDITVTPGETLTLYVGSVGEAPPVATSGELLGGWPDGGNSGSGDGIFRGCSGGGSTRIYRGIVPILIVGAGGGARGSPLGATNTLIGDAGVPGSSAYPGTPIGGGGGGTPTAGGAGGIGGGFPGSSLQGGKGEAGTTNGSPTFSDFVSGAGGGGGLYGGGGGSTGAFAASNSSGGGGGSSYILGSTWTTQTWNTSINGVLVPAETLTLDTGFGGYIQFFANTGRTGWSLGLNTFMG